MTQPYSYLVGEERTAARQTATAMYQAGHTIRCAAEAIGRSWTCTRGLLVEAEMQFRSRGSRCTANH